MERCLASPPIANPPQRPSNVCGGFLDGTFVEIPMACVEHLVNQRVQLDLAAERAANGDGLRGWIAESVVAWSRVAAMECPVSSAKSHSHHAPRTSPRLLILMFLTEKLPSVAMSTQANP
jgi:hypothetical protein